MGKITKEEQARRDGMAFAFKIAKEKGIEGLEQELKFRNIHPEVPISIPQDVLDEFTLKVKQNMVQTFELLCAATLHDEFGMGKDRLTRFVNRLELKAECIGEDYCTWQDYVEIMKDECKMDFVLTNPNGTNTRI